MKIKSEIFWTVLLTIFLILFSGCVRQQQTPETTKTIVEEKITTTTAEKIQEMTTIATTFPTTSTITTISDCNKICSDEGYQKTLGSMSAIDCDKNAPENSQKKWKFNCCCYNEPCTDSDGGQNFYEKGITKWNGTEFADYCREDRLFEYFCSDNALNRTTIYCAYGCSDGACIPETTTTTEIRKINNRFYTVFYELRGKAENPTVIEASRTDCSPVFIEKPFKSIRIKIYSNQIGKGTREGRIDLLGDENNKPKGIYKYDENWNHLPSDAIGTCSLPSVSLEKFEDFGCSILLNETQSLGRYWLCVKNANWDMKSAQGEISYYWNQVTNTQGNWVKIDSWVYKGNVEVLN